MRIYGNVDLISPSQLYKYGKCYEGGVLSVDTDLDLLKISRNNILLTRFYLGFIMELQFHFIFLLRGCKNPQQSRLVH